MPRGGQPQNLIQVQRRHLSVEDYMGYMFEEGQRRYLSVEDWLSVEDNLNEVGSLNK